MTPINPPSIAQRIREGRMAKGITQQELADLAGISLRSVQRIENEETVPRSYTVRVLTQQLGIPDTGTAIAPENAGNPVLPAVQSPAPASSPLSFNPARNIILSAGLAILLAMAGSAFIFQSPHFPETLFEATLFWMGVVVVYMLLLLRIWRK